MSRYFPSQERFELSLSYMDSWFFRGIRLIWIGMVGRRIGLDEAAGAGQQKVDGGEAFSHVEATATGRQNQERQQEGAAREIYGGVHSGDRALERVVGDLLLEPWDQQKVAIISNGPKKSLGFAKSLKFWVDWKGGCDSGGGQLKDYIVQLEMETVKLNVMRTFRWFPGSIPRAKPSATRRSLSWRFAIAAGCVLALFSQRALAADTNTTQGFLESEFQKWHKQFQANTNSAEAAWNFGRACFDMSTLQKEPAAEARYAEEGIEACRAALAAEPNCAQAHYYLGMDMGQLADTKRNLSALWMVKDMEREFLAARTLDKNFDFAGPGRNLGLLYRDAPVIASIGSRSKARQYLEEAVQLAPGFPENQLNLIESYLKWDYQKEAQRQVGELEKIWPAAKEKFTGVSWQASWVDWDKRLDAIRKKIGKNPRNESPHSQ